MAPTAPPIDGQTWFNTPTLERHHLRGRTVVMVFWAAGCEASLRRVQQVQDLVTATDEDDLVAVAVHTPRMPSDEDEHRLAHVTRRYRISVPVVHDPQYRTWSRYQPPGWPSTAVIDPNGRVSGIVAGCDRFELIEAAVADARSHPRKRRRAGDGAPEPLPTHPDHGDGRPIDDTVPLIGSPLRYPEDVATLVDRQERRWFAIADTGHDRVLVGSLDPQQRTLATALRLTGLDQPSAVEFLDSSTVVVVERGTNLVWAVDLADGGQRVVTDQPIRPTGLARDIDGSIVIADAGGDQLYRATANSRRTAYLVHPIAGSGRTGVRGGYGRDADLAQPCALVRTPAGIVFCDAASSNVRLLTDAGEVVNITGSDLYQFGLVDGVAHRALLERPSGVASLTDGSVIVVDGGNNRLRRVHQRRIETIGLAGLDGPTGIVGYDSGRVLVADTNQHRLLVVDADRHDAWAVTVLGGDALVDRNTATLTEFAGESVLAVTG